MAADTPGLARRFAALGYDALLLMAVLMVASFVFLWLFGDATHAPRRYFFQAYLLLCCALYFVGFWLKGGQTLAMRTWKIRLVSSDGGNVFLRQALLRFCLAPLGWLAFWWVWLDKDGRFLHDRLTGTRLARMSEV